MTNGDNVIGSTIGALIAILLTLIIFAIVNPPPIIPRCPEDATIIGFGEYEDGRWDHYSCGPALDELSGD